LKVGITGQGGFVGSHLYNYLNLMDDIQLIGFKKSYFENQSSLCAFVSQCDVIVHLSAMNRHDDPQVIYDVNVGLVKKLLSACVEQKVTPKILFSSSTQEDADNPYGLSKKDGGDLIAAWAEKHNAPYVNMVIPNVFGPFGKPYYNSVVATFCHQLTHGEEPSIINDGNIKMIYINELTEVIYELIKSSQNGKFKIEHKHEIKVSALLEKLQSYRDSYLQEGKFPNIDDSSLDLALFNTFRCYIDHDHYPVSFIKHTDDRGSFVEIVRANTSGQFSFSTTKPGITRGNHFHTRKSERFAVIQGKAKISLRKIDSEEVIDYIIEGDNPAYVDMPIWHTHNITNIGEDTLITLFWINEPYDAEDPDTYFVIV